MARRCGRQWRGARRLRHLADGPAGFVVNVLTLVHGRRTHLANLIRSLERSTVSPDALVIVQMNEAPVAWQSASFPIIHCAMNSGDARLPLAAARNAAVTRAPGDDLVFLDVDCLCAPDLLTVYRDLLARHEAVLYQGEVRYLPQGAVTAMNGDTATLTEQGSVHPLHAGRCAGDPVPHALFWSLNFACRRDTFMRMGGFDTRYLGYGGEDTDFAFRAAEAGVPVEFAEARAFHQFHPSVEPPLNHLASVVANSRLFREHWGVWPMEGWLRQFAGMGYIALDDKEIELLRLPTHDEITAAMK